ncbi:MAG TPA: insulinase family protein, partial [Alphaproteobacteria bacterium]|nr:insulinase family protein [Alphaproteobacteria bacterium]
DAEFQKNSISGLATVWSEAVAVQGLKSPSDDLARIDKVTVDDVNRAARKYLDLANAVTAVLTPSGSGKPVTSGGFGGQEDISVGSVKGVTLPDWAQASLSKLALPKAARKPVVSKLPNGITLVVQPEDVSNTVSVIGHIRNRPELMVPKGKEGLSQVLDNMFSYGTKNMSRQDFQAALDAIGANESAGVDFSVSSLSGKFDKAVSLLADNELHPLFTDHDLTVVKGQVAGAIAGRLKSPGYLTGRAVRSALFPADDPTLRQALPSTVKSITMKDLRSYYHTAVRPDLAIIVVIGDVTPAKAKSVIEKHFGAWTASGPTPSTLLPKVPLSKASTTAVPDLSRVQDNVTMAETLELTRSNPDYYAIRLGNSVLGGSFYASRLSRDIRKNAGLVYAIDSYVDSSQTRGLYVVEYACDPKNVAKVQNAVARELKTMQATPVSADELHRAKAVLLRQIPLGESSENAIAHGYISRLRLDLPLDEPMIAARHYMSLDASAVQAAFAKWIRSEAMARVSQGPAPK